MVEVGQMVKYDPFQSMSYLGVSEIRQTVTGVVTYVNHKRGWFTVENSGNEVVRWSTVYKFLTDLGVATCCNGADYRSSCPDYIPENIFYRLAMKAKNETAERFQALVADEIIPSIRKHGAYMTPTTLRHALQDPDTMIQILQELKQEQAKNRALTAKTAEMRPKALFADSVATSSNTILVGELAKILRQNGMDTGEKRLFARLRDEGYLIRRKGTDYNMPTQKSMELELFQIKETVINHSNGLTTVKKTIKVTGKGQQYFINKFLGEKQKISA